MNWLSSDAEQMEQIEARRLGSLEETIVKKLLTSAGVKYRIGQCRQDAMDELNEPLMSLAWFHLRYPAFPVRLTVDKIRWGKEGPKMTMIGHLFGSHFARMPFFKAFQVASERLDINPQRERMGLVFAWPGIDAGGQHMVIHNYPLESHNTPDPDSRTERGTRIVRPYGRDPVVVYVVESLNDLLTSIGTDWADQ